MKQKKILSKAKSQGNRRLGIIPTRNIGESKVKINGVDAQPLSNGIMVIGIEHEITQKFCEFLSSNSLKLDDIEGELDNIADFLRDINYDYKT